MHLSEKNKNTLNAPVVNLMMSLKKKRKKHTSSFTVGYFLLSVSLISRNVIISLEKNCLKFVVSIEVSWKKNICCKYFQGVD